jgi:hypothetical protein
MKSMFSQFFQGRDMKVLLLSVLIIIAISIGHSSVVRGEKLDLETHNSLIQKLESVLTGSKTDTMVSQPTLAHRLADLYAERARLLSLEKEGQGDKLYRTQIESDRSKALSIYSKLIGTLDKSDKGIVLMQMAHLHNLQNSPSEAQAIYQQIESNPNSYSPQTLALAKIQLGDLNFFKGNFPAAQQNFESAIKIKENPRIGYCLSRLAWTNYNRGLVQVAERQMILLLRKPQFLTTKSGDHDLSFHEESSHDLATFMAKTEITSDRIVTLSTLSPDSTRKKNLIYLATELDRTAKKNSALQVWAVVGTHNLSLEDQIDRQIQITRIQYDLGHKTILLNEIDKSLALLKQSACTNNQDCVVGLQNLRKVITDWGKAEERVPSEELVLGYQKYTNSFDDYEVSYWAAHAAQQKQMYSHSFEFYKSAARLSKIQSSDRMKKIFEGSLLGAIEVAEISKDRNLRLNAYLIYLELNPNGNNNHEVSYQIAHWYYEMNQYSKARELFRTLALDPAMPADLREKSADLCLDSNVILKDEPQLEQRSLEFANSLKNKAPQYLAIWRKSILNQTAQLINGISPTDSSQNAKLEGELRKIQSLGLQTWPADQRRILIKNKILISLRLKNMDELAQGSKELLNQRGLSIADQNMALHNLAWTAEIKLNFPDALKWMKRMQPKPEELADFLYKMAALKELNSENPTSEYTRFLAVADEKIKKQFAAHQIILFSKGPQVEFRKYESLLSSNSPLYGSAGLWAFEKTKDQAIANKLMARRSLRTTEVGLLLNHYSALNEFEQLQRNLQKVRLVPQNDRKLQKALASRVQTLRGLENTANQSIKRKDSTMQLLYLTQLSIENAKLGDDILSLPIPRGLTAQQKRQYRDQLQVVVQPYQDQSRLIQQKTLELWQQATAKAVFKNLYDLSRQNKPGSELASREIRVLRNSAQRIGLSHDPFRNFSEQRQKTASEAESLEQRLRQNPFSVDDLEKMKAVHRDLGGGPMVAYIDVRLNELKTQGGKL